jgi:hypothetical protein
VAAAKYRGGIAIQKFIFCAFSLTDQIHFKDLQAWMLAIFSGTMFDMHTMYPPLCSQLTGR